MLSFLFMMNFRYCKYTELCVFQYLSQLLPFLAYPAAIFVLCCFSRSIHRICHFSEIYLKIPWRMPCSGMWRRVELVWTDVSEERIASIFMVEKSANEEPAWTGGCPSAQCSPTVCSSQAQWSFVILLFNITKKYSKSTCRENGPIRTLYSPKVVCYLGIYLCSCVG
jgi:hypothetical protein